MLNRYRILLGLVYFGETGDRLGLTRTQLMKSAFLLSRECEAVPRAAAYGFVPYKYGPFSFSLYRDADNLQRDGYLSEDSSGGAFSIPPDMREQARREIDRLSSDVRIAIDDTVRRCSEIPQRELLREIYSRFPWYASRSELDDLAGDQTHQPPPAELSVYTCGYEGHTVDSFFDRFLREGIETVIDVRRNPVSRVYGFARSSMGSIAEKLGMSYVHLPEMGIEGARRKNLQSPEDYEELLDWYQSTLPEREEGVEKIAAHVLSSHSVLICVEADPSHCHRGRLADALAARTRLPVHHLT